MSDLVVKQLDMSVDNILVTMSLPRKNI